MDYDIQKIPQKNLVKFVVINQIKADIVGTDISIHMTKGYKSRVFNYQCDSRFKGVEIPDWVVENFLAAECKNFRNGNDANIQEENAIFNVMLLCDNYRLNIDAIATLEKLFVLQ